MTDTELEDQLIAMLRRRASDITAAPPIRLAPPGRRGLRPRVGPLLVAAGVAAVVFAAGSTVVGVRSIHHSTPPGATPTGTPTSTAPPPAASCTIAMPVSWQRAITTGKIPLDHPYNEVISVRPGTGEYLVRQLSSQPTPSGLSGQATLALFDGKTGQDIAATDPGTEPVADGSAAISADWIAYGLYRPGGNSGYTKVVLHDRRTGQDRVLDQAAGADNGNQLIGKPVLFGGKVFWLEVNFVQNRSTIKSYDPGSGVTRTQSLDGSAYALVYYRTGLAIAWSPGEPVTNYLGTPLAQSVIAATVAGDSTNFTFDGSTLRWWSYQNTTVLYANRPGSATIDREPVAWVTPGNVTGVSSWPFAMTNFVGPTAQILDLRTNVVVSPPRSTNVQAVIGDTALIGTGGGNVSGGLSLVPLNQLPAARC